MNKSVIIIALIVVLLGGFALVQSQKNTQPSVNTTTTTKPTSAPTAMQTQPSASTSSSPATEDVMKKETTGAVKEFTVSGKNFSFSPGTLSVNKGDTVKITFKNSGGFHDFVIDEFNIKTKQIQSGQEETVEFTADQTGTFEYYCSVGNHRTMGMKGILTVK